MCAKGKILVRKGRHLEKEINLEKFLRKQEKAFRFKGLCSGFLFLPVTIVVVSLSVLAYNFTVGKAVEEFQLAKEYQQEVVPEEKPEESISAGSLNLNEATAEQLDTLPGIGEKRAAAIVRLRGEMGGFFSEEDILNVDGIGEKIYLQIKDMIYVE